MSSTMQVMAKKKTSDDRHKPRFVIHLPLVFREQLAKARALNRRPMTEEIQIALEEHLAKLGLWPPKKSK